MKDFYREEVFELGMEVNGGTCCEDGPQQEQGSRDREHNACLKTGKCFHGQQSSGNFLLALCCSQPSTCSVPSSPPPSLPRVLFTSLLWKSLPHYSLSLTHTDPYTAKSSHTGPYTVKSFHTHPYTAFGSESRDWMVFKYE